MDPTSTKDLKPAVDGSVPLSSGVSVDLEAIVKRAYGRLLPADQKQLRDSQLDDTSERTEAGSKLDRLVTGDLRQLGLGNGWTVHANRAVRTYPGVSHDTINKEIEDFVMSDGLWWARTELAHIYVNPKSGKKRLVGNLRADLVIQDPTNIVTIWDLTSDEETRHVAKTLLYAHVFSRGKYLCRIGETHWVWLKFPG